MSNIYLAHHGVKGMKWGVRKKRDDSGIGGKLRKLGGSLRTTTGDNGMSAQPKRPKNTTNWDQPESAIKVPTESATSGNKRGARKDIRNTRDRLMKEHEDRLREEYGIEKKRDEVFAYGNKHNLDLDDGGGGDIKAGKKYMKMWDEISELESKAYRNAKKYTNDDLIRTYGQKAVDDFAKYEKRVEAGKVYATAAALLAVPIGVLVSTGVSAFKN